jgi:hypothetical protein
MKELEALNKMLGVILAYRPPRKKKKKAKRSRKVEAKRL